MKVKFWGVRGSIPISSPKNSKYGGNTSCVEVKCDDKTIILDSGTGIMPKRTIGRVYIYFLAMSIGIIYRVSHFFDRLLTLSSK